VTLDLDGAGRLVRYGLDPRLIPARSQDYKDLVAALADPAFAHAFRAIAFGQGLEVLGVDPILGVTFAAGGLPGAAEPESPYAMRLSDYARRDNEDRLLHALIHLAIAATAYPTAEALEEDRLVRVSVGEIIDVVSHLIERLRERMGPGDPPEGEPGLEPLYRFVGRYPITKTTPDSRAHLATLSGATKRALGWLVEQGFADKIDHAPAPDTYRLRTRFRIHVRDAAAYVGTELDVIRAQASR